MARQESRIQKWCSLVTIVPERVFAPLNDGRKPNSVPIGALCFPSEAFDLGVAMSDIDEQQVGSHGERREASRFGRLAEDDFAAVWLPQCDPILAEVQNESLHGLCLVLDVDCGIGVGSTVHIVYAGACHTAQARHVAPHSDGRLLIGFHCEALPDVLSP